MMIDYNCYGLDVLQPSISVSHILILSSWSLEFTVDPALGRLTDTNLVEACTVQLTPI